MAAPPAFAILPATQMIMRERVGAGAVVAASTRVPRMLPVHEERAALGGKEHRV